MDIVKRILKDNSSAVTAAVAFFFLDGMFFLWQPYPKAIIKVNGCVSDAISALIWLFLFCLALNCFCIYSFKSARGKLFSKKLWLSFAAVVIVQLAADALQIIAVPVFGLYNFILSDTVMVLLFPLSLFIVVKIRCGKDTPKLRLTKPTIVLGLLFLLIFLAFEIYGLGRIGEMYEHVKRLEPEKSNLNSYLKNEEFLFQTRQMYLSWITDFFVPFIFCRALADDMVDNSQDERQGVQIIGLFITRTMTLALGAVLLTIPKYILLPQHIVSETGKETGTGGDGYGEFDIISEEIYCERRTADLNIEKCSNRRTYKILYDDKLIGKFEFDPADNNYEGKNLCKNRREVVNENTIYEIIYNEALAFVDDGTPYFYYLEEISDANEDENLTYIVRRMIIDGFLDYYIYGAEYLEKYDPEFIGYYTERYADGVYLDNELDLNEHLNFDYITELAQSRQGTEKNA